MAALLHEPADRLPEVWLNANLSAESAWVPRILNLESWERGESIYSLARQTVEIKQDKATTVTISSPRT